jgi:hypothetical protein
MQSDRLMHSMSSSRISPHEDAIFAIPEVKFGVLDQCELYKPPKQSRGSRDTKTVIVLLLHL